MYSFASSPGREAVARTARHAHEVFARALAIQSLRDRPSFRARHILALANQPRGLGVIYLVSKYRPHETFSDFRRHSLEPLVQTVASSSSASARRTATPLTRTTPTRGLRHAWHESQGAWPCRASVVRFPVAHNAPAEGGSDDPFGRRQNLPPCPPRPGDIPTGAL